MAEIVLMDGHVQSLADLHEISSSLEDDLRKSLILSIIPGIINLFGTFVLDFNTLTSLLVNSGFGFWGGLEALPQDGDEEKETHGTQVE
jgi:hypothetical protein